LTTPAGHEPYVADPAEPPPRPALGNARPVVTIGLVLVTLLAVGVLLITRGSTQDPAIGDPVPTASPTGAAEG